MRCTARQRHSYFLYFTRRARGEACHLEDLRPGRASLMQRLCLQRHVEDKVKLSLLSGQRTSRGTPLTSAELGGHGMANREESFSLGDLSLSVAIRSIWARQHSVARRKGVYYVLHSKPLTSCQKRQNDRSRSRVLAC